jgi:hypothetical protein
MLQQAAECAYKALLLVYTNYTPYNHHIDWFDRAIRDVVPDLPEFFPRGTKEAEERFKNFDYAYIAARYSLEYVTVKESPAPISAPTPMPGQAASHENQGGQEWLGRRPSATLPLNHRGKKYANSNYWKQDQKIDSNVVVDADGALVRRVGNQRDRRAQPRLPFA